MQYSTNGTLWTNASNPQTLNLTSSCTVYARYISGSQTAGNKTYNFVYVAPVTWVYYRIKQTPTDLSSGEEWCANPDFTHLRFAGRIGSGDGLISTGTYLEVDVKSGWTITLDPSYYYTIRGFSTSYESHSKLSFSISGVYNMSYNNSSSPTSQSFTINNNGTLYFNYTPYPCFILSIKDSSGNSLKLTE